MSTKQKNKDKLALYYSSLTIQNIRCFGSDEQTLICSLPNGAPAQWTVILGNNGVGKTTILQALASLSNVREDSPSVAISQENTQPTDLRAYPETDLC